MKQWIVIISLTLFMPLLAFAQSRSAGGGAASLQGFSAKLSTQIDALKQLIEGLANQISDLNVELQGLKISNDALQNSNTERNTCAALGKFYDGSNCINRPAGEISCANINLSSSESCPADGTMVACWNADGRFFTPLTKEEAKGGSTCPLDGFVGATYGRCCRIE